MQGVPNNSSDDEWESSIKLDYGERGAGMLREAVTQVDAMLDTVGLVNHSFHQYDYMANAAPSNFGARPSGTPPAHVHAYEDVGFFDAIDEECIFHDAKTGPKEDEYSLDREDEAEVPIPNAARSRLHHSAQTLLFAGSRLSSLTATLLLLNLCRTHQCSNLFITELLTILGMSILPEINTLPRSEYMASKILRQLGLEYESIHMCPNNCLLFRGDINGALTAYSVSHAPRYRRVGDSWMAMKILRHFPLIPRLKRLFSTSTQATLQTW